MTLDVTITYVIPFEVFPFRSFFSLLLKAFFSFARWCSEVESQSRIAGVRLVIAKAELHMVLCNDVNAT